MKPNNTNSTSAPQKPKTRKILIVLALLIVILAAAALYFYQAHKQKEQAYQADKTRFAKVESDMKTAYDGIVAAAGVPDVSKQTKNCSNVSLKFKKGQLNCGISYEFAYPSDDYANAINVTRSLQTTIIADQLFNLKPSSRSLDGFDANNQNQPDFTIFFTTATKANCSLYFSYINPAIQVEYQPIKSAHISKYIFGCSADMDKPIYSLAK